MTDTSNRRPLKSRGTDWSKRAAAFLADGDVAPDMISFIGIAFALAGGAGLATSGFVTGAPRVMLLFLGAVCIQLRLLCNLLDGMVAVEHGKGSQTGPIWNELPDRIADTLLLAGAGYGAFAGTPDFGPMVGWLCAVLAVMTAYVRELGRGLGFPADFSGPLGKPQRMAVLTATVAVSLFEGFWHGHGWTLFLGLCVIAVLTGVTLARRTTHLARALKARSSGS